MAKIWSDRHGIAANLSRAMPKLVRDYFEAGRKAMKPSRSWDEMHEFRLESKRFRYTLELFQPLYGKRLDPYLERLKQVQDYLGDINDAITARGLLKGVARATEARKMLADRASKKSKKLREYWTQSFDADQSEIIWSAFLASYGSELPPPSRAPVRSKRTPAKRKGRP